MRRDGVDKWNKTAAIITIAVGTFVWVGCLIWVIATPISAFEFLDRIPLKFLLVFVIGVLIFWIGICIYRLIYRPTATRLISWIGLLLIATFVPATGFSIFGWPKFASLDESSGGEVAFNLSFQDVSAESWKVIAVYVIGMLIAGALLAVTRYFSVRLGEEI